MARKILITVFVLSVALVVGLLVAVSMQPSTFAVERSATMAAPPAALFARVNDLAAWDTWSPWSKLDPNAKTTLSTPSAGKGATIAWDGNDEIGQGTLTILESKPDEQVHVEQEFVRPFAGKCRMAFTFVPDDGRTKVTWRMEGINNFIGKAMCMIMDMDATLGPNFEQGLANMKKLVEKGETAPMPVTPAPQPATP